MVLILIILAEIVRESAGGLEESKEKPTLLDKITKKLHKRNYYVKEDKNGNMSFLQCDSDEPFKFEDQKHYDLLGDMLCEWIQAYMVTKQGLKRVMVPDD